MRDSRTLCGTFEEITHSNFNLPITAITGTWTRPSGKIPGGTALPERIASLCVCVYQTHDKSRRPLFLSANQWPPVCLRRISYTVSRKIARFFYEKPTFSHTVFRSPLPSRKNRARISDPRPVGRPFCSAAAVAAAAAVIAAAPVVPAAAAAAEQDDDEDDDPQAATAAAPVVIAAPHLSTS